MKLQFLKDDELEQSFRRAVRGERKIMHIVVLHVQEVYRRKLYLARGYGSLREYLIKEMKYSGPAAQRRIEAAKLMTAVPSLAEKLESGEINLSQIGEMHRAIGLAEKIHQEKIGDTVKAEIIEKVAGHNVVETQQMCAEFFDVPVIEQQHVKTQKDFSKRLELTFTKEQFEKYEQIRDLLAHKNFQVKHTQAIADVLETLFDDWLRMQKLDELPVLTSCETDTDFSNHSWKCITPLRRRIILQRDRCCQFQDPSTGIMCETQFDLQVDHIIPRWAGGQDEESNLRVLCRQHNLARELGYLSKTNNSFDLSRDRE